MRVHQFVLPLTINALIGTSKRETNHATAQKRLPVIDDAHQRRRNPMPMPIGIACLSLIFCRQRYRLTTTLIIGQRPGAYATRIE
jgi:hypothetical protein